jgi:hypothetical protein
MRRFRIAWVSNLTGTGGHGEPIFADRREAQGFVTSLNARFPELRHWVEEEIPPPPSGPREGEGGVR